MFQRVRSAYEEPKMEKALCTLRQVLELAETQYRNYLDAQAIELDLRIQNPEYPIGIPRSALVHIITTLYKNAVDAMGRDGTIKLWDELLEDQLLLHIANTGPAIPNEHVAKIFERGFSTKTQGTGRGLALAANILKRYRGRVKLAENKEGWVEFDAFLPSAKKGEKA